MAFINTRLPSRIAAGFKGGPRWKTTIVPLDNGREQRNQDWLYSRYEYTANFGAFNATDRQALIGIFHATAGKAHCFRFKDATDYFVVDEPASPVVGTTTVLQLSRGYSFGAQSSTKLVQAPVSGSVVIKRNGTPVSVTVDDETGLVTPNSNWASGTYTWDGQYDLWVRFDSDWGAFTAVARDVWTADIDLIEVRR